MVLERYQKKRDFKKTPEPKSGARHDDHFLHFLVQKHAARHLHYDLRLENRGVLKSWAVPKGISMDPDVKRLAIQVEDHPFDYKDFEGQIPKGNYGAGNVIIWDEGSYTVGDEPDVVNVQKSVEAGLKKGHLNIDLKGQKLKGIFTLVRLKSAEKNWLIMKKKDMTQREIKPPDEKSVRSGKAVDEVALSEGIKADFPRAVQPMLATLVDKVFDKGNWIFELKWDGYRSLAEVRKGKVKLYSRNNNSQNDSFPVIVKALQALDSDVLLDGEIVVLNEKGNPDFQMLQNYVRTGQGRIVYYVFDLLYADGYDLRSLPLRKRKGLLETLLPKIDAVRISDHIETKGVMLYKTAQENGLEGIMAKDFESPYRCGSRSEEWLKIKTNKRQEAIICGFTQPRASRNFFGALILGIYKAGLLTYIGHTGSGFDEKSLKVIYDELKPLITPACPFTPKPKTNMPVTWVRPVRLCEVKFAEWTKEGHMRQPIFMGLRKDKDPTVVVREVQKGSAGLQPSTKAKITNPEKIFWRKEKYTKGDVIDYYSRMDKWILPYLKDRPQSLNRFPNGIEGKSFYQKDVDHTPPPWAKTVMVDEVNYLLCQDRDTLLYMANLACIEINVWNSRVPHLERPDYIVFDFDPIKVDFKEVVKVVLTTRDILEGVGIESFCKTSGGRGMHIYIPLSEKITYEQAKDFSYLVNVSVRKRHPDITSLERSPAKRQKRIYLDFLQNHQGATMAAPYCLRPREGAPVSMPLKWEEVTTRLNPLDFNIRTVPERVSATGDLWADLFKERKTDLLGSLEKLEKLASK